MTRTILLADDSVTIQKVIELTFMEEDYEVVSASDGDEALERLEEITPDFVIADVHMPGASGIDVCRRSKELNPQVPVLLLVGTFEPFDEGAARAAGADAHLKKPFDSQELIQLVGDLMGTPEAGEAAPEVAPAEEPAAAEPEGDDTWGFSAAAAELEDAAAEVGAEPVAQAGAGEEDAADLDWAAPLEPLPEEEEPEAAGQTEEPAPVWEQRPAEAATPSGTGGEPFHLGPVERAEHGGEVFDLREAGDDETAEVAEEIAEPAAAGPAAGSPAEGRWGTERWGFAVDEPAAAEAAAGADTGWEEVEEPFAGAEDGAWGGPEAEPQVAEPAWGEPEDEEVPPPTAAPPPWEQPGEEEARAGAPPPDWDGESEPAADEAAEEWIAGAAGAAATGAGGLSEHDIDRIARRVAELLGERVTREVVWEVVPDLAEVVIRERLRELEGQID
jgi:CheY-like chemotaxis protein